MEFGRTLLAWGSQRERNIDVSMKGERFFSWNCCGCKSQVSVPLRSRLNSWEMFPQMDFTLDEKDEAKKHYAMGPWSRSPCGGAIHFEKISCASCQTRFLFSYGVNEPSNSNLILTVQGVIEIVRE